MLALDKAAVRHLRGMVALISSKGDVQDDLADGQHIQPVHTMVPSAGHRRIPDVMPGRSVPHSVRVITVHLDNEAAQSHDRVIAIFKAAPGAQRRDRVVPSWSREAGAPVSTVRGDEGIEE